MKGFPPDFTVALISPAGGMTGELFDAGVAALQDLGARVKIFPAARSGRSDNGKPPYLAASDEKRASDLQAAFADDSVQLILASRGGYGCARILDMLDWSKLRRRVMVAGFSDITALHWAMCAKGAGIPVAAPMLKYLSSGDEFTLKSFFAALRGEKISLKLRALNDSGKVCALPLPGNLTVAASLAGTPYFPDSAGKILILEDVGELPYRLDRSLTQLRLAGAFRNCAAVVFGSFTGCGEAEEIMALQQSFAAQAEFPVFCNCKFGHQLPMMSFNTAVPVEISAE